MEQDLHSDLSLFSLHAWVLDGGGLTQISCSLMEALQTHHNLLALPPYLQHYFVHYLTFVYPSLYSINCMPPSFALAHT